MTKISTKVTLEICDEIGVYNEIERHSYEFDGPIAAQCKKGRDANANNTKFQQSQANQYAGNANTGFNSANDFYQNELNLNPGGMSSPAAAMYASDLANIKSTYNGLKQNAFATAGERGFGNAPSGFMQATQNGLNQAQANAQTQAYNAGIINTQNQRQNAAAGEAGLYGQSTAGEAANTNAANTSAFNQSRMGSTLGDVLSGASSVLGGITGMGSLFGSGGGSFYSGASASPVTPTPIMTTAAAPTFSTNRIPVPAA